MIVEILSFIPSILLVQFFRRIQSRRNGKQQMSPLVQAIHQIKQQSFPYVFFRMDKGEVKE